MSTSRSRRPCKRYERMVKPRGHAISQELLNHVSGADSSARLRRRNPNWYILAMHLDWKFLQTQTRQWPLSAPRKALGAPANGYVRMRKLRGCAGCILQLTSLNLLFGAFQVLRPNVFQLRSSNVCPIEYVSGFKTTALHKRLKFDESPCQ